MTMKFREFLRLQGFGFPDTIPSMNRLCVAAALLACAASILFGCGSKVTLAGPKASTVYGQVFVVLKCGQTLKLSLVPIAIYEKRIFEDYTQLTKAALDTEIERMNGEVESKQSEISDLERKRQIATEAAQSADD